MHLPGFLEQFKQSVILSREKRAERLYQSCHTAFENYKEETGLLYVHLNKTPLPMKKLTVHDKLGFAHQLDLESIAFALQKKAHLVYPTLKNFMEKKMFKAQKMPLIPY